MLGFKIAVILCAGYATRLYPLTEDFPKPLLPIAGRPLIDYLIDQLVSLPGLDAIHVITNAKFCRQFESWRRTRGQRPVPCPIPIELHNDGSTEPANRLGALVDLQRVLQAVPVAQGFLAAAGDNIFLFDLAPLWDRFCRGRTHLVVALPETDPIRLRRTGVAVLDSEARLLRLDEKPSHPASTRCIPPLYFLQAGARPFLNQYLAGGGVKDALGPFIDCLCRQQAVYAHRLDARRLHIGDRQTYRQADRFLACRHLYGQK